MKSEFICTTVLPGKLLEMLSLLELTNIQHNTAIAIVQLILWKKRIEKLRRDDYVTIPSKYLQVVIGSRYDRAMNALRESGIVQDTNYSWEKKKCKAYRINPSFMTGSVTVVQYTGSRPESDKSSECRSTLRFMRSLHLDVPEASAEVESYILSGQYRDKIVVDPDTIFNGSIGVHPPNTGFDKVEYRRGDTWKSIAQSKALWLIQDGSKYYIDDPVSYYSEKEMQIRLNYIDAIHRFPNKEFYAKRNDTNNRLDSTLSSFPSILLKHMKFGKDREPLVSIDLCNSQFAIFAKLVEHGRFHELLNYPVSVSKGSSSVLTEVSGSSTGNIVTYNTTNFASKWTAEGAEDLIMTQDMMHFVELAKTGQLYEYVQEMLEMPVGAYGRRQAKQMMFGICFSGWRDNRPAKELLKIMFPTVVKVMDQIKKKHGNNKIAVELQREESRIFIDHVKKELDARGYDTATKHDSVLCPLSQRAGVEAIVREILDRELGEYQLKVEMLE